MLYVAEYQMLDFYKKYRDVEMQSKRELEI